MQALHYKKTANDNERVFSPQVAETVWHNFYVDDCVKSVTEESEAVQLVKDLAASCGKKVGFSSLSGLVAAEQLQPPFPQSKGQREPGLWILTKTVSPLKEHWGLQWCADSKPFSVQHPAQPEATHTRRGILSVVSSTFDPLGFLAPLILPAARLLQELRHKGLGWDEPLALSISEKWKEWTDSLKNVKHFDVPRCRKPKSYGTQKCAQLHHFADASESGYGSVSHIKQV